ncbi:MAG: hypothetical protein AAF569_06120 [Pseudomonadota bacterium]
MSSSEDPKVEVYNRINKLKLKAGAGLNDGPGKLDQNSIDRANSVVTTMASLYPTEIRSMLMGLEKEWLELKDMDPDSEKKSKLVEKMSNTANQIKDLGTTFGYNLMGHFGESLRDFILKTDLEMKEHLTIVQAHIDVMAVTFRENLKDDDGGPVAEELKQVVATAIEKFAPDVSQNEE